jgi:hypothetical protein
MPKYLPIGLSIAIFLLFGFTLFTNTLNIPTLDDYDTTVGFIKRIFFDDYTAKGKFELLFGRHNEHRIIFSKIVAAAYFSIFQRIDFANLILLQNLLLLCFFVLMLFIMKRNKLLYAENVLFASVFLFSLAFWQVSFYYWGGIQHYTVFFFCFLSLFLLDKSQNIKSKNFFLALLTVLIAVFSFGNGFLCLLLGAFMLFVQRKWPLFAVWSTIAIILLWITFFIGPQVVGLQHIPFNISWMLRLLFTFLGSFLFINPPTNQFANIYFCAAVGVVVMIMWIWLFFKGYAYQNPLLYCLLSMPILTGVIISISRFETTYGGGIAPRYMFFTATIPVILMLIFLDLKILRLRHLRVLAFAGVLLWGMVFYNNRMALQDMNRNLAARVLSWQKDPETRLISFHEAEPYSGMLRWAVDNKVVNIPDFKGYKPLDPHQK